MMTVELLESILWIGLAVICTLLLVLAGIVVAEQDEKKQKGEEDVQAK